MGGEQSSESEKNFYERLRFVKSLDISKSLMQDPNSKQIFAVVEHTFPSQLQMKKFQQQLQKRKSMSHQYYLGPNKQFVLSTNNLCSKQHKVIQIFKWEEHSLNEEIKNRIQQKRTFLDRQIWSILCSCVLAMSYFTKNQIIHTTLHPKDIILTNEGQVKILSSELSEFQFDYNYKHGFYYAPETLKAINTRALYNISNKAAVFTLGLTLLSVINCKDMSYLYKDNLSIDFNQLHLLIQQLKRGDIKEVLLKMLKAAPYQRISFTELEDMLYSILQNNQINNQADNSNQQKQIQKLQESIFRLKTKQQVENEDYHQCDNLMLSIDQQDLPNAVQNRFESDIETLDEAESIHKERSTTDNSRAKGQTIKFDTEIRVPLADKSNSIQISESLKIVDDKKGFEYISGFAKTSRVGGSYYVTEQYNRGRYEGYKQNGVRQGFGTFFYEEGGKYCGEWSKNKMEGRGALYYTNGELAYQGEWSQDQLNGYGVLYNQTPHYVTTSLNWKKLIDIGTCWVKYEGHFSKDARCGQGTLFLSNGQYFRGEFKNDQPHGKGIFRELAGQLVKGFWSNGVFQSFEL